MKKRLFPECEKAKITLSTEYEATVQLENFIDDQELNVTVLRDAFEEKADSVLERLLPHVEEALNDA